MIVGYQIARIDRDTAARFLANHHYLSQLNHGFLSVVIYGLFNRDTRLVGVIVFNTISAVETLVGAFGLPRDTDQMKFLELTRLAMDDERKEKNLTSWFVSRAIRRVRRDYRPRALISYADSAYHVGYIYQATNWKYYGLTAPKNDYWLNGKIQQRGGTTGKGGVWKPRARKHRYALVFDRTLQMRWQEEPYPKGKNNEMPLNHKSAEQDFLFV